jgi:hypothetical protein
MTMAMGQPARAQTDRIFFTSMAIAAALSVFIGFTPTYFLRVSTLPPLTLLYHVHGALFMTWIFLFIAQTALVADAAPTSTGAWKLPAWSWRPRAQLLGSPLRMPCADNRRSTWRNPATRAVLRY